MQINTILFDLDGTLINTNDLIMASFQHTLNHYYPDRFSEDDLLTFIGEPLYDSFKRLDKERAREMVEMYREHNIENHEKFVTPFPGVIDTVKQLDRNGFKLAVVTSKMRESAELGLKITKLSPFFDVVVTVDDVTKAKPAPEPLEKAMARLQATPESTLMVGDSQYDIIAGKKAGTYTAGVAWSLKGKDFMKNLEPDLLIDEMPELLRFLGVK